MLKNYPGNKSSLGLYQFIINRIPKHNFYFEPFAGSAIIARKLNNASVKYISDCNPKVTDKLHCLFRNQKNIVVKTISVFDRLQLISSLRSKDKIFTYLDPPYMFACRSYKNPIYTFEFSDSDHLKLLSLVDNVNYNCMISHPRCELYDRMLKNWNKEETVVRYHSRTTTENIYYNYPKPTVLQQYNFLGSDCWERQRISRKINSLLKKLSKLEPTERNAIVAAITDKYL